MIMLSLWYQMWSNDIPFKSPCQYSYFGTNIGGVRMENICSRFLSTLWDYFVHHLVDCLICNILFLKFQNFSLLIISQNICLKMTNTCIMICKNHFYYHSQCCLSNQYLHMKGEGFSYWILLTDREASKKDQNMLALYLNSPFSQKAICWKPWWCSKSQSYLVKWDIIK